jgi:membrane protein YqaA with SNARE-associated domain
MLQNAATWRAETASYWGMNYLATARPTVKYLAVSAFQAAAGHRPTGNAFIHFILGFGLFGVFLVSIVDSSFVPLPLPGITDVMIIVLAAQHQLLPLLIIVTTVGSALGGYFSYEVAQRGGMAFLEKRVPARIFKRVCKWMETHAILSVALPAILPPPMPLSPFVLAAGALRMSKKKFMTTFTISRGLRHALAAWLGVHYGRHILHLWNGISEKYATPFLIAIWTLIIAGCGIAFWQIYRTSRKVNVGSGNLVDRPNPTT